MNGGSEVIIPLFGFLDLTGEVITELCIIAVLAIVSLIATHNLREAWKSTRFYALFQPFGYTGKGASLTNPLYRSAPSAYFPSSTSLMMPWKPIFSTFS